MKKNIFIITLNWVDVFSLSGLICSLLAIGCVLFRMFDFALSLLFLALWVDILDGILARRFNLCRSFGVYLDSFIDVVDYLVAPALFLFLGGFNQWYYVIVLFILIICGIIRLSVFNEVGNIKNKKGKAAAYLGMPVYWIIFILGIFQILSWLVPRAYIYPLLAVTLLLYAWCMIFNAHFFKFTNWKLMSFILLGGVLIFIVKGLMAMGVILCL